MNKSIPLEKRMKQNYENRYNIYLTKRTPVIIKIKGKYFYSFYKKLNKSFDDNLIEIFQNTCKQLFHEIQGCKLIYSFSNEINILITDYDKFNTSAWFDYNIQKLCSASSSITTIIFNKYILNVLKNTKKIATFDTKCFNIPKEEVNNYFIWRQNVCIENNIREYAKSIFSYEELINKSCDEIVTMILNKDYNNYINLPSKKKYGIVLHKYNSNIICDHKFKDNFEFMDEILKPLEE